MLIHMMCGDQHITVDLKYPLVEETIHVDFGRSFAIKQLKRDSQGKPYFVWNKTRMYLDYLQNYTMDSIQKKLDNNEFIQKYELILAIINDGIDNVRFVIPCHKRSDADIFGLGLFTSDTEPVLCKISEHRYKVQQQYKLSVTPEQLAYGVAGDDYYIDDFVSLLKSGYIKIAKTCKTAMKVDSMYYINQQTGNITEVEVLVEDYYCTLKDRSTGNIFEAPYIHVTPVKSNAELMRRCIIDNNSKMVVFNS